VRVLLDTSVLIHGEPVPDVEAAISVASLAELHFGALVAADDDERAVRTERLGTIEATFDPLPITADVAREWGRLAAAVRQRGGQPRRRAIDLAIAATANVHGVPLLTHDVDDLHIIRDLTDARSAFDFEPAEAGGGPETTEDTPLDE
jgi:predicted nucleic acid-binding protein